MILIMQKGKRMGLISTGAWFCFWTLMFCNFPSPAAQVNKQTQNEGLYGYDCSSPGVSTKVVSLLGVQDCPAIPSRISSQTVRLQLLHMSPLTSVQITTCRVFKSYSVYRCGMHSHQMLIGGPVYNEPIKLNRDDCASAATFGRWQVTSSYSMLNLKVNQTTQLTITEEGSLSADGSCSGSSFNIGGKDYKQAFIRSTYEFHLEKRLTKVDLQTNSIFLKDGLICNHDVGECFDTIVGHTFWTPFTDDCEKNIPYLLADTIGESVENAKKEYDLVRVIDHKYFISKLGKPVRVCGRTVYPTDFQNVVVLFYSDPMNPPIKARKPSSTLLDPVLYSNAKLSYLHYKMVDDLNQIYHDVLYQLCQLEKKVLENTLNIVRISGGNVQNILGFGGRGTLISIHGEVAHITKCPVKQVQLKSANVCYDALPVTFKNETMFLQPISRILLPTSSEIPCNPIIPNVYQVNNQWIGVFPRVLPMSPPEILHPTLQQDHPISVIKGFAEGGIYSPDDLAAFYTQLTAPTSRKAILDHFAESIESGTPMKYDLVSTVSEVGWKRIAENHLRLYWGWFSSVGVVVSGFLGIYVIYVMIIKVFSVIVRFFTLKKVYGCSWFLCGSLLASTTTLVLSWFSRGRQAYASDPTPHVSSSDGLTTADRTGNYSFSTPTDTSPDHDHSSTPIPKSQPLLPAMARVGRMYTDRPSASSYVPPGPRYDFEMV